MIDRISKTTDFHVLLYHGVHSDDLALEGRNSSGKHIARHDFEQQMKFLSENKNLVSMRQIADAICTGTPLPEGSVAVNFDDGFFNNYSVALPVLEKFQIPTTIYLATGFIGTGRKVWSDCLEALILMSNEQKLDFGELYLGKFFTLRSLQEKVSAFLEVKAYCKLTTNAKKDEIISFIERQLGARDLADDPLYSFMNWDQVREMDKSPLINFGAHTVDHVSLARVSVDEMKSQISTSVEIVTKELGHQCEFFSYPEGQAGDYNDEVIDFLKVSGFDHSPSAIDGVNNPEDTDPFHIRRIMVGFEDRAFPFE
jgi:peptidoglycan/xylan/chitin deacetylase (PgdA/CDA1 family)